ncbi:hypothetical protein QBC41DRAFT_328160 [Cercophora samala]|uniref:Uncharacterized protein n=1 Tax=Cercophora samala TaxID=330535 RepID=A0AA40D716_9PEZI|nr:hypothetical protein QBC41DRAFT_328160 [Cercophora samala]
MLWLAGVRVLIHFFSCGIPRLSNGYLNQYHHDHVFVALGPAQITSICLGAYCVCWLRTSTRRSFPHNHIQAGYLET